MLNSPLYFLLDLVVATVVVCTAIEILIHPTLWPLAIAAGLMFWLQTNAWSFNIPLFLQAILTPNNRKRRVLRVNARR